MIRKSRSHNSRALFYSGVDVRPLPGISITRGCARSSTNLISRRNRYLTGLTFARDSRARVEAFTLLPVNLVRIHCNCKESRRLTQKDGRKSVICTYSHPHTGAKLAIRSPYIQLPSPIAGNQESSDHLLFQWLSLSRMQQGTCLRR